MENIGGAAGTQANVRIYVLTSGKNYTYQSVPVTGFEINGYYNDDASKQVVDTVVSTWRWK